MSTMAPEQTTVDLADLEQIFMPYEDTNDPNVRAHIVRQHENMSLWSPGMTGQDIVDLARMLQVEVVALCGHRLIPKHQPQKFDACGPCLDIAANVIHNEGV